MKIKNNYPMLPFPDLPIALNNPQGSKEQEKADETLLFMTTSVTLTEVNEMPIVSRYAGDLPSDIRGLHRTNYSTPSTVAPHFYFDDKRNRNFFRKPFETEERLQHFKVSISTDFSMTKEMSRPQKVYSSFLNKLWAGWLQSLGHNVIPNVSFPNEYWENYWLEGWPKNSIIAVSSIGVLTHGIPSEWLRGMERIQEELQPIHILRYGPIIPGEYTKNCSFYNNDNNRSANGW
jgi:hypothetical protein